MASSSLRVSGSISSRVSPGVAASALRAAGIPLIAQRDHRSLGALLAALDPTFTPDPEAADFVDHPWYRESFGAE